MQIIIYRALLIFGIATAVRIASPTAFAVGDPTAADGRTADFSEANLRFKIDSSDTGQLPGKPFIMPSGMMGDRGSVFVAARTRSAHSSSINADATG